MEERLRRCDAERRVLLAFLSADAPRHARLACAARDVSAVRESRTLADELQARVERYRERNQLLRGHLRDEIERARYLRVDRDALTNFRRSNVALLQRIAALEGRVKDLNEYSDVLEAALHEEREPRCACEAAQLRSKRTLEEMIEKEEEEYTPKEEKRVRRAKRMRVERHAAAAASQLPK
jgi:hypothetical protein